MSNYNTLKSAIQAAIKTNGNNEITGQILQDKLLSMIATLGFGYQFMGIAFPNAYPGTPDAKIFYIAYQPGTYTYMGGIEVTGLCVLKYDTNWVKEDIHVTGGGTTFTPNAEDLELVNSVLQFANRVNPNNTTGLGYKILRANSSFASQVTAQNTIYEIRDAFDLSGETVNIPSGCILRFNGGSLSNGNVVYNNTEIQGTPILNCVCTGLLKNTIVSPQMYGAKGDAVNDDTTAFVNLANWANSIQGKKIYIPSGHYIIKSDIIFTKDIVLFGDGETSILDFSASTTNCGLQFNGSYETLNVTLTADVAKGANVIPVSDGSVFSENDLCIILNDDDYSFSTRRAEYKQGQFFIVRSVSGNNITLKNALFAAFATTSTIKFYKINAISVSVSRLKVIEKDTGSVVGATAIKTDFVRNSKFSDIFINGTNNSHLTIGHGFEITANNIYVDYFSTLVGYNYGIMISNSENVIISNSFLRVTRDAISTGGTATLPIVDRNIRVDSCFLGGDSTNDVSIVGNHENIEYFTITNCNVDGKIRVSGNHVLVANNVIKSETKEMCVDVYTIGDDVQIKNNDIYLTKSSGAFTDIIGIYLRTGYLEDDKIGYGIVIDGNKITMLEKSPESTYNYFGVNIGASQSKTFKIVRICNNFFESFLDPSISSKRFRSIFLYSYVDCLEIADNSFFNKQTPIYIENRYTGDHILISRCNFLGLSSEACIYIVGTEAIAKIIIEECFVKQVNEDSRAILFSGKVTNAIVAHCIIYGNSNNCTGIIATGVTTVCNFDIYGNKVVNCNVCMRISGATNMLHTGNIFGNILGKEKDFAFANYANYPIWITYTTGLRIRNNIYLGTRDINQSNNTNLLKEHGTTDGRPTPRSIDSGYIYYDTDLNKSIVWTGTAWKNVDGSAL